MKESLTADGRTDNSSSNAPNSNIRSRTRQADSGVLDELNRLEQRTDSNSFATMQSQNVKNLKALKNMSPQVQNLIENRPMQSFATKMALDDTNRFMTMNLKKRQPIFKNHTKTNSSILRSEIQCKKKETMS